MNHCPMCDAGEYNFKKGCENCGFVDVDKQIEHEKEVARSMKRADEVQQREPKQRW